MADEALRELERAVAGSPDDGPARLALAHGLARAGRRDDALAALDLRRVGEAELPDARALSDRLWRDALSRLALAWTVELPFSPGGFALDPGLLAVSAAGGAPGLVALDPSTGAVLLRDDRVVTWKLHPVEGGAVLRDGRDGLVRLRREGAGVRRETRTTEPHVGLLDVDPSGGRLLLAGPEGSFVRGWPDLRPLAGPLPAGTTVDWALDLLLTELPDGALEVRPLEGGEAWTLPIPLPFHASRQCLGHGLHACSGSGLALAHVERRWALQLVAPPRQPGSLPAPSLASDGRGLRVQAGDRPVRVELDLERGALASEPRGLDVAPRGAGGPIHPHADAWATVAFWLGERIPCVEALDGTRLARLPDDHAPRRWSPDGRSLLCTVWSLGRRTTALALWRVAP